MLRESGFFPKGAIGEDGNETDKKGNKAEQDAKSQGLTAEAAEAFDMTAAPEGPIAGDLGEMDREMEAAAIAKAREAIERIPIVEEGVRMDQGMIDALDRTTAKAGPIENEGLAELDRMLDEDARIAAEQQGEDDGDMKKAA